MSMLRLPDQLWIDSNESGPPSASLVGPPATDYRGRPAGGIWTSTLTDEGSSAWRDEMLTVLDGLVPVVRRRAWALRPTPARVWEIETRAAELDLVTYAPGRVADIWPKIAKRFDAVHMTAEAARCAFHRIPRPDEPEHENRMVVLHVLTEAGNGCPLDMWETESTVWFGWHFDTLEDLGWLDVPAIPAAPPQTARSPT